MSKIFLVNIGANAGHGGKARSPIFADDTFQFVSFPKSGSRSCPYPKAVTPFIRQVKDTHLDPDWENLTYGDGCVGVRGHALRNAERDDILLFWGLLWRNRGSTWDDFTGEKGWYLLGALRIDAILKAGHKPTRDKSSHVRRAAQNAHCRGVFDPEDRERVFIGNERFSKLFPKAVDLQARFQSGLLFQTVRTTKGEPLTKESGSRCWIGQTRPCRVAWDLEIAEHAARAKIIRRAILEKTGFDFLPDVSETVRAGTI